MQLEHELFGVVSISPLSTSLTYVAILHLHLQTVYTSRIWFSMQELVRHTIIFFNSRLSNDKEVGITEDSTFSFKFYGRYNDLVCPWKPSFGPHAVWYVSYQSLSRLLHTDLAYGSYVLPNLKIELTADATGRQESLLLLSTWSHFWYIQR
jgi:hypothetical protein